MIWPILMSEQDNVTFIAQLYQRYKWNIRKLLMHRTSEQQDVEDIMQDIFLKAHKVPDWNAIENPESYLVTMAKNIYNDHMRRNKKSLTENAADITEADVGDDRPTAEQIIISKQDIAILEKVINSLTPRLKQALIMIKVKKLSYAEAAEIMNISKRTLENHVVNAMAECRRKIKTKAGYGDLQAYSRTVIAFPDHKSTPEKTEGGEE